MSTAYREEPYFQTRSRHPMGSIAVVALHGLLVYAVINGTAYRAVDAIVRPVKVALLDEPVPPPPPPAPVLPPPPQIAAPPPVYVPPPEVQIRRPVVPPPVIAQAVRPPPPAPVPPIVVAAAPPAPVAPAAPPVPAPDLSRPAHIVVADCEKPQYPPRARREEATGTTGIRFRVDKSGRVVQAQVTHRSGHSRAHRLLDAAAVQALGGCRFTPGTDRQGHPSGSYASVEYVWSLE